VFKNKLNAEGKVEKYKDWLVEKGYSQVEGIEFGEFFSPVTKLTSIRFILSVAAALVADNNPPKFAFIFNEKFGTLYF
jgi:hypothetical protein